ncbi:MAG: FAD-dependent oxidoreductase [Aggregatilineales bacterium]
MSTFKTLLSPIQIGQLHVKNRVMVTAHTTNFSEDGIPTDKDVAYYGERAKGGAGLIIIGALRIHPTTLNSPLNIMAFKPEVVPMFQQMSDAVHEHGGKIIGQILHMGRQIYPGYSRTPPWSCSPIPCPINKVVPHEMTQAEIREIIEHFVITAGNAKQGGMDGVEIHGAHGYLIQQFMSPWSNHREDDYGGSLQNRLRFAFEVIDAVRQEVGQAFVVGFRLSGEEFTEGGLDITQMSGIARLLSETNQLDYLSVSQSNYNPHSFQTMIPDMHFERAPFTYLSAAIKDSVDATMPVFTVGRILDPVQAEEILASSAADMVGMTRAHIADPDLVVKAQENRLADIRLCISCNQGCADQIHKRNTMSCLQNPAVGHERTWGSESNMTRVDRPKNVMIIGGGVAGMEAAIIAKKRGHHVTLYEASDRLGGQINTLVRVPERAEFYDTVRWRVHMLDQLAVSVQLNTRVTAELIQSHAPDVAILATGATPAQHAIQGFPADQIFTVEQVLSDTANLGERVVLIDGVRHYRATATAEHLAKQGKTVFVLTKDENTGGDIPKINFVGVMERFANLKIRIIPRARITHAEGNTLHYVQGGFTETLNGIDSIVMAMPLKAKTSLHTILLDLVPEVHLVGDCLSPRNALEAIWDGHQVGWKI